MKFKHKLPVQLRFNDVDIVGHVNNAVYQEYFDTARLDYFQKCFKKKIDWTKAGFVIASIQIDFFNAVFMEDEIFIYSAVESLGEKSLVMNQIIKKTGIDDPVAQGKTVMVSFDYSKRESIELPEEWKKMLEDFEERDLV